MCLTVLIFSKRFAIYRSPVLTVIPTNANFNSPFSRNGEPRVLSSPHAIFFSHYPDPNTLKSSENDEKGTALSIQRSAGNVKRDQGGVSHTPWISSRRKAPKTSGPQGPSYLRRAATEQFLPQEFVIPRLTPSNLNRDSACCRMAQRSPGWRAWIWPHNPHPANGSTSLVPTKLLP